MKWLSWNRTTGLFIGSLAVVGVLAAATVFLVTPRENAVKRVGRLVGGGDLRSAQVELRNVVRATPSDAKAHLALARLNMKLADPVAAQAEYQAALANGADATVVIPLLGEALLAQGLNRETLEQVPPDGPTPAHAVRNLLLRGIAQLGLGDIEGTAATLQAAQAASPGSMEVILIEARLAAARGNGSETQAKVAEALRRDPMQIDALLMQEQLETAAGNSANALELADRAVTAAPWSAMARMRRANQLVAIGRDGQAQDDVNAVLSVQPRFIEAVYLKGLLLARRGKLDEAGQEMDKLSGVGPRLPQALYYRALLAAGLGQLETAADLAERYHKLMPDDVDGIKVLARAQIASRRPEAAVSVLQQATVAGKSDAESLDLLGRAYGLMGDAPSAMDALKQAVTLAPEDAGMLARYGVAQMRSGQIAGASATLERSLALAPEGNAIAEEALIVAAVDAGELDRAEAALAKLKRRLGETESIGLLEGAICLRRSDLDGARAAFAATLRTFPGSTRAKMNLAAVSAEVGRLQESATLFADILSKNPADERALTGYVRLLVRMDDLPHARAALERAHSADPKRSVITAMLADSFVLSQDPGRAIAMLQEDAVSAETMQPPVLAALARAKVAAGLNDDAKESYRALLGTTPQDLEARGQLVTLLLRTGDVEGAKATLREAAVSTPGDFDVLSNLVRLESATGGIEGGLKLAGALRADPANGPAAAWLKGDLLRREKRFADAVEAYQAEYTTAPTEALLLRLAGAEDLAGQVEKAEQNLRQWLADRPGTPEVLKLLARFDIRAQRLDDAAANLTAVLAKQANDPMALNNLAWVYHLQGDKRARSVAQTAYLQAPTADAGDTLGWIMVQGGESKAALPLLQRSGAARPRDPQIHYHLAVALKNVGQRSAAAQVLASFMKDSQSFDDRQAAGELMAELAGE